MKCSWLQAVNLKHSYILSSILILYHCFYTTCKNTISDKYQDMHYILTCLNKEFLQKKISKSNRINLKMSCLPDLNLHLTFDKLNKLITRHSLLSKYPCTCISTSNVPDF